MAELPRGTVTFLFTDIEGSTRLLKQLGERYSGVLADQRRILREAAEARDGHEIDTQGDSFFFAFTRANAAVGAAVVAQRALAEHDWPEGGEVRVRMGLHTGEPVVGEESYVGLGVHRAARIGAVAHGGQVLLSNATRELVEDEVGGVLVRELGAYRLKDIDRPERLYQLDIEGLRTEFPPLKAEKVAEPHPLRRRAILLSALAGVIAAAVAIPIFAFGQGSGGSKALVVPKSVAVLDPKKRAVVADVPVAGDPTRLAVGGRTLWVGNDDSGTVSAFDLRTHAPTKLVPIEGFPSDLAVGEGAVWVVDGKSGLLHKVDPAYGTVRRTTVSGPNPAYDIGRQGFDPMSVAAGLGSVWVTDGSRRLVRVDPKTTKVVDKIDLRSPLDSVAVGAGALWATSGASATVIRLDHRGRVTVRIPIASKPGFESPYPLQVKVGEGFVWVLNGNTATVTKIDPEERSVSATIAVGIDHGPVRLAVGDGAAWVANGDGTLSRIDATTNAVTTIPVGHGLKDVAVTQNAVWVTTGTGLSSSPAGSSNAKAEHLRALPTSACSPIYYEGRGAPQYLIASDLPLQGTGTLVPQLSQAVQFVLRQRGFRAGRYAVGYQSCDDSIVASQFASEAKCAANARAFARTKSVLGIIGPFTSICSQIEIPIANRARGGPLGLVNFSNTYLGLTRAGPGTVPGEPRSYYPTGIRNYMRVVAADNIQGAADAIAAKHLGARRFYVLYFAIPYGYGISAAFESRAARLGLRIVGRKPVDILDSYKPLAAQIRRTHPDAVFIAGFLNPSTVALIRDLRSGLDPSVKLMGPDGYQDFAQLVKLEGPAAEGMTVSVVGVPNDRLPPAGKKFVAAFAKEVGEAPGPNAAAAAQATGVLLDAIARSDGTRRSVVEQLFKTKVSNGVLGDFSIDRNGDTTAGAVTIYRIVNGKPRVLEVITPRR